MPEFWESVYHNNEKMWGEEPTDNAKKVMALFKSQHFKNILIPGFGYGRNAKVFYDNGLAVTGIEISKTAIARGRKYFGEDVTIHHGSVTDMPFDNKQFEAIYCYSLIHLLNKSERKKLIADCYSQLLPNGHMVFVALSIKDPRFGVGQLVDKNTFESPNGLTLYFYDEAAVIEEFGIYNIIDSSEIDEPQDHPTERHWMIVCNKLSNNEIH